MSFRFAADLVDKRSILAESLALSCLVAILGLTIVELAIPFVGDLVAGAMLAYVTTDLVLGAMIKMGPGWVKVFGNPLFTTEANGFWALLTFVVVVSPVVVFLTEFALPALALAGPMSNLTRPILVSALAVLSLVGDYKLRTRR